MRHHFSTLIITVALLMGSNISAKVTQSEAGQLKGAVELTAEQFDKLVFDIQSENLEYLGKLPAIVDFTATWCGPCRQTAPILDDIAREYAGKIVVYKVDVDKCEDLARAFNISSIPALLFIPMEGQPEMIVGLRSKEAYKSDIEKKLLKK